MNEPKDIKYAGLEVTREALGHLERSMFHLHQEKAKYHPQQYAIMAEPTAEEILKLRAQIDELIGLTEFATSGQLLNPIPPVEAWEKETSPASINGACQATTPVSDSAQTT